MKQLTEEIFDSIGIRFAVLLLFVLLFLVSCASVDPRKVDVELKEEPPAQKITSFWYLYAGPFRQNGQTANLWHNH